MVKQQTKSNLWKTLLSRISLKFRTYFFIHFSCCTTVFYPEFFIHFKNLWHTSKIVCHPINLYGTSVIVMYQKYIYEFLHINVMNINAFSTIFHVKTSVSYIEAKNNIRYSVAVFPKLCCTCTSTHTDTYTCHSRSPYNLCSFRRVPITLL